MELSPDTLLHDRYRITDLLGKGGMGAVYLAFDIALEQNVAVKINDRQGSESTSQFIREARLLAGLRHTHLPRVIDYFILDTHQVLVMDYIPGVDLREVIAQKGAQPLDQVLKWAGQLGSAIEYLHHQAPPIIHRDIKPANIKLTPQGDVILVDFGIAKTYDAAQQTQTGATGYTPGFAPPEQYGSGRTGVYSDQFSLAATIYMLLTAQRPEDAVQRALGQSVLTPMNLLNPAVPRQVQLAVEKALAPKVEDRYSSVHEFIAALTQPVGQIPAPAPQQAQAEAKIVLADEPTRLGRSPEPPKQTPTAKPAWLFLAIGGAVLILGAAILTGVSLWRDRSTSQPLISASATEPALQPTAHKPAGGSRPGAQETPLAATATVISSPTAEPVPTLTAIPSPQPTEAPLNYLGGGGWVVFSSNRADGVTFQLWKMQIFVDNTGRAYSSEPIQITFDDGDKTQPAWSPDGTQLVYSAPGGKDSSGQDLGLDLWKVNLDGSHPVDLTRKPGDDTQAAWSPDSSLIAFTNNGRQDGVRQLYFVDSTGSNLRRLSFDQEEFSPAWSPDGNTLLFVLHAAYHDILYTRSSKDDFTEYKNFDRAEVLGRLGNVTDPAFTQDGTQFAYTRVESHYLRIATVRYASGGSDITTLTNYAKDSDPTWSPDANWIVFTSNRDGNQEIYIMNASGQFPVNLTNAPGEDIQPAWQPVGITP